MYVLLQTLGGASQSGRAGKAMFEKKPRKKPGPKPKPKNEHEERQQELEELERALAAAKRRRLIESAKTDLLAFTKATMPDPNNPDDPESTRYKDAHFHRLLAQFLMEIYRGDRSRGIIAMPPRHGKSELVTKRFPAWCLGQDPYFNAIIGTYNQTFAGRWGKMAKELIKSKMYQQIFPEVDLVQENVWELLTSEMGQLAFVGRGGSATGKGADILIIDDPIKDREEARSPIIRDQVWSWFQDTVGTRLMSDTGKIVIVMTRWHEDDLVGRLTDPNNPFYNEVEAARWDVMMLRALAEDDDPLGRQPGEPLWPERFGADHFLHLEKTNPVGFASLYQQRPSPQDGNIVTRDMIRTYAVDQLPQFEAMNIYAASDHALGQKQENDYTVMLTAGVDRQGQIWILDCWWKRANANVQVEQMITIMKSRAPSVWWSENDHITKSIGPFLTKRRIETGASKTLLSTLSSNSDKVSKFQAIAGRMQMGMVYFPESATWTQRAVDELLVFPNGTHDDFCDALGNLGRGLHLQGGRADPVKTRKYEPGTYGYMKEQSRKADKARQRLILPGGM